MALLAGPHQVRNGEGLLEQGVPITLLGGWKAIMVGQASEVQPGNRGGVARCLLAGPWGPALQGGLAGGDLECLRPAGLGHILPICGSASCSAGVM